MLWYLILMIHESRKTHERSALERLEETMTQIESKLKDNEKSVTYEICKSHLCCRR